jgi:hypothetical protein
MRDKSSIIIHIKTGGKERKNMRQKNTKTGD